MKVDAKSLPDDPQKLKDIISSMKIQSAAQQAELENELEKEREKYTRLHEKFMILQKMYFGRKSEKLTPEDKDQMYLFNEAEDGSADNEPSCKPVDDDTVIAVKGYTKKKPGRKPIPSNIPREEVIHDLSDEEKQCPCCGKERPVIGREETEELEIIPAEIKVLKHIKLKYGPCACDDFLIFTRIEVDISRATMANWAVGAASRCGELIELMIEEVRGGPLIQMDETTLRVLHEPEKSSGSKSYMWVTVGHPRTGGRLILYQYHPTRSETVPLSFLQGYDGYLQSDGYAGYNKAGNRETIMHVGCFAHARRYFHDALKLNKKSKAAHTGLSFIQKLYRIEHTFREGQLQPDEFVTRRKQEALPVLDEFHAWLLSQVDTVPPESRTGKAVRYALSEWDKLVRYLDHHLLTPDNNAVENAIRPFVLGRKNWLFSNTPRGAESSAVIHSLIESAKANGLEPYKYLRFLFVNLPGTRDREALRTLLPNHLSADMLNMG